MADVDFIESCKACRFFVAPDGAFGVCRRYPAFQNVHCKDWCGEFAQKPKIDVVVDNLMEVIKPKRGRKTKVQE